MHFMYKVKTISLKINMQRKLDIKIFLQINKYSEENGDSRNTSKNIYSKYDKKATPV